MGRTSSALAVLGGLALLGAACGGGPGAALTATKPALPATGSPSVASPTVAAVKGSRGAIGYAKTQDFGRRDPYGPGASPGGPDTIFTNAMYRSFLEVDNDKGYLPGMASQWDFSSDGLRLKFTLRPGAKFQNGDPVTMDDVLFTFRRMATEPVPTSPTVTHLVGYDKTNPEKIFEKGVVAADASTVVLNYQLFRIERLLDVFNSASTVGFAAIPKKYFEQVGGQPGFAEKPVGTGPYRMVEFKAGESMKLEAFQDFYNGPPPVKTITIRIIPEDVTRVAALQTGQVDIVDTINPVLVPQVDTTSGLRVFKHQNGKEMTLWWNLLPRIPGTDKPNPFLDVRVRKALNVGFDREAIVKTVLKGLGFPVYGMWGDYTAGYAEDRVKDPWKYNPQSAKALLSEAGFPMGQEFPVYSYTASAGASEAVQAVVGYWQELGLKAKYTEIAGAIWPDLARQKTGWPLLMIRSHYVPRDPYVMAGSFVYSKAPTSSQYPLGSINEFDAKWEECEPMADTAKREGCLKDLYVIFHDQALGVPIYADIIAVGIRDTLDWKFPKPGEQSYLDRIVWLKEPR